MRYGKLTDKGIEYFNGNKVEVMKEIERKIIGKDDNGERTVEVKKEMKLMTVHNPKEETLLMAGWMPVEVVSEDGNDEVVDGVIKHYVGKPYEQSEEEKKASRIMELKRRLADTDYCVIKIAEGTATKEEYADVIAERAEIRKEINELEA